MQGLLPFAFKWDKKPNMPFEMSESIQAVFAQGKVYIGGGAAAEDDKIIMEFDTFTEEWKTLPPYKLAWFAMVVLNDELVLVGGHIKGRISKTLGVWLESRWTYSYPKMPTARCGCSAITEKQWLAIAGGQTGKINRVSCVEVLNTDTHQWHSTILTPVPWTDMKTAVQDDTCYFMGGCYDDKEARSPVMYSIPMKALLHVDSTLANPWKRIPVNNDYSSPLSVNGHLLAFGGVGNKPNVAMSSIYLYNMPDNNYSKRKKLGEMPSSRYHCASTMISTREIFIAGGSSDGNTAKDDCYIVNLIATAS